MGDNIYAKFGDMEGSAQDDAHVGYCKLMSINHGLQSTVSGERDQEGGANVGRPQHYEIDFSKLMDGASMDMTKACLLNTPIDIEIEVVRQTGSEKAAYLKYTLTNCFITSISHSAGADGEGTVEVGTINYGVIKWDFTKLDKQGKGAGDMHAGWDREQNIEA